MKINRRLLTESIIVTVLIILAFLGWEIVRSMLLTMNYVPDLKDQYQSVENLQSQVSFGIIYRVNWLSVLMLFSGFFLMIVTYYVIRTTLKQMIKKNNSR